LAFSSDDGNSDRCASAVVTKSVLEVGGGGGGSKKQKKRETSGHPGKTILFFIFGKKLKKN